MWARRLVSSSGASTRRRYQTPPIAEVTDSDLTSAGVASNPSRTTRTDLAGVVEVYRRENERFHSLTSRGIWGGIALGVLLVLLRPTFGLIDDYNPVFFLGGVALGLAQVGAAVLHRRGTLAGLQVRCASCGTALPSRGKWEDVAPQAELVVATGVCPTCGNEFVGTEASARP